MESKESAYRLYYTLAENMTKTKINFWEALRLPAIECALWPPLYPFKNWCESVISGAASRESAKTAFAIKLCSQIKDYGHVFDLLQFQYDRLVYYCNFYLQEC